MKEIKREDVREVERGRGRGTAGSTCAFDISEITVATICLTCWQEEKGRASERGRETD